MPILTSTPTVGPAEPLTAAADPDSARIALRLQWPAVASATVSRVDPDGTVSPVRGGEPAAVVGGSWSGFDYEAPFDVPVTYRAVTGLVTQTSTAVTLPSFERAWLKHPGLPVLNMPVHVARLPVLQRAANSATLAVLGRLNPVVVSQRRAGYTGAVDVWTDSDDAKAGLWGLLNDGTPLLFAPPGGTGVTNMWLHVGDVAETRVTDVAAEHVRLWQLPFTVVDRPVDVVVTTVYDWAAVVDEFTSWSDLVSQVGSWSELVAGGAADPAVPAP